MNRPPSFLSHCICVVRRRPSLSTRDGAARIALSYGTVIWFLNKGGHSYEQVTIQFEDQDHDHESDAVASLGFGGPLPLPTLADQLAGVSHLQDMMVKIYGISAVAVHITESAESSSAAA